MNRLARLACVARSRTRLAYAQAAGFFPAPYRLSRIMGDEGATNVRFANGDKVPTVAKFTKNSRVCARPAQVADRTISVWERFHRRLNNMK